jgi:hypothetical protein
MFTTLAVSALVVLIQTLPGAMPFPGYGEPLFAGSKPTPVFALRALPIETAKPKIVCNMPMIHGNGDVDPKIVITPPKRVDYKIRIIEAPACH